MKERRVYTGQAWQEMPATWRTKREPTKGSREYTLHTELARLETSSYLTRRIWPSQCYLLEAMGLQSESVSSISEELAMTGSVARCILRHFPGKARLTKREGTEDLASKYHHIGRRNRVSAVFWSGL